jgi:hypothetical protein
MRRDPVLDVAYIRVTATDAIVETLPLATPLHETSSQKVAAWKLNFAKTGELEVEPVRVGPRQIARRSATNAPVSYWKLDRALVAGLSGSALISPQGALLGLASGNSEEQGYYCDEQELAKFFARAGLDSRGGS